MGGMARAAIAARRGFTLGEVVVEFRGGSVVLSGPSSGAPPAELEPTVEALQAHVRLDEHARYRPLSGARTMSGNWRVSLPENLAEAAIDAIYPQALLHQEQSASETLRIVTFDEMVGRQRGRYRVAGELGAAGRERAREVLCGRCVRTPVWAGGTAEERDIPCPEPCSVMVALAREAALWQEDPPPVASPDSTVPFADFSTPGNEVREAYLARTPAEVPGG
ncbi:MAG: hypothetical protein F4Z77_12915 [Dehalococcoidia bacterium]|nr:hypothetical protein [Dehalococcoidia bacterium]MYA53980.1 hypothetical protein [Dehalococcoidia bacterium]